MWSPFCPLGRCKMVLVVGSEPECKTNLSLADHWVSEFDFISVSCYVRYRGSWAPSISCEPTGRPAFNNVTDSYVSYEHIIPASPQIHGRTVVCTTTFNSPAPDFPPSVDEPLNTSYTWTSPTIRVTSKIAVPTRKCNGSTLTLLYVMT